jgi:hypothetical protein
LKVLDLHDKPPSGAIGGLGMAAASVPFSLPLAP